MALKHNKDDKEINESSEFLSSGHALDIEAIQEIELKHLSKVEGVVAFK